MPIQRTGNPNGLVPAFHANKGVQAWYYAELMRLVDAMRDDLGMLLAQQIAEAPPAVAFAADAKKTPTTGLQKTMERWGRRWSRQFDKLSLDLSMKFADRSKRATQASMKAVFEQAGWTINFKPSKAALESYQAVVAENVNLIRSIPQKYLTDVQSAVWQSVTTGNDMAKLQANIQKVYGVTQRRAALIARDQTNKAKAVIENTERRQLGITEGVWQHSRGGKTPRPTHVAHNGKRYSLETGWYDPDAKERVWPGTLINCRCTSMAVIPGFAEIDKKHGARGLHTITRKF